MHKTLLKKIDYNAHKECIEDSLDMLLCDVKERNPKLYDHVEDKLYVAVYGKKINDEMADTWVKDMKPIGQHWNIEETTNAMQSLGYNLDKINFYVVSNMMYNDYYDLVKDDETLALKMAYDWLYDVDANEGKLYDYWKYIVKRD